LEAGLSNTTYIIDHYTVIYEITCINWWW